MDPNNGRYLMRGSDCVYEGGLVALVGKTCTITQMQVNKRSVKHMCVARFDHDARERVVDIRHLVPKDHAMKNFKTLVKAALDTLIKPLDADSEKEQAVRQLGVSAEIVRIGEAEKKKAKSKLSALGIITGDEQNGVVFDSSRYVVTATTKAASSRLDQAALVGALNAERLSQAAITRILSAATVTNKAATSFSVESK